MCRSRLDVTLRDHAAVHVLGTQDGSGTLERDEVRALVGKIAGQNSILLPYRRLAASAAAV